MRTLWLLLCLVALPASGAEPERPELAQRRAAPAPRPGFRHFGVSLELGAPDILGLSIVARPLRWLRLQAGVGTDTAAVGVHGGFTFVPLDRKVSPSLTIEGGHMFQGGSSFITQHLSPKSYTVGTLSYDYANAHLGLEVGLPNRVLFYIHAGASYVSMHITGHKRTPPSSGSLALSDPALQIWGFSGKLGLVVYFL